MSVHLERKKMINTQQKEVAVNSPDGATLLISCMGVVEFCSLDHEPNTFLVGPQMPQRQLVGVIVSGALSTIQGNGKSTTDVDLEVNLVLINANYDDESGQVKVSAEISSSRAMAKY